MKIICYSQKHLKPSEQLKLQRKLYGFKDFSNKGKYIYRRSGLLNDLNHKKIFFTGIVADNKISIELIKILRKHRAKIHESSISSKKSQ